jgi:hypothetical protein
MVDKEIEILSPDGVPIHYKGLNNIDSVPNIIDKLDNIIITNHNCSNCVWRLYGQCPHNISNNSHYSFTETGLARSNYCNEYYTFLYNLSKDVSLTVFKEKFFLYCQELQAMSDLLKFNLAIKQYDDLITQPNVDQKELARLQMVITSYRLWWQNLTINLIKSLSRINDRESRINETKNQQNLNVHQLNVILNESSKILRDNNNN